MSRNGALVALAASLLVAPTQGASETVDASFLRRSAPQAEPAVDPSARFLLVPQGEGGAAAGTLRTPESYISSPWGGVRALGEIIAFNGAMTLFGRWFMTEGKEGFIVSTESIKENLQAGFEWDDNTFSANNFRHPYQGGMYFNAARSNGFDFWESSFYAFLGSWLWEYTGENHHPSVNDWLNTGAGGIALGEMTWRLSSILLDNTATSGRVWRELGGALISPMRGVNRLVTGEAFDVHQNAPDRLPDSWDGEFGLGIRTLGEDRLWDGTSAKMFVLIDGAYGDAFEGAKKPYDHFDFGLQLNFDNKPHGIGRILVRGFLGGVDLQRKEEATHLLTAYQNFDYFDNEAYTFGGQSAGMRFASRFRGRGDWETRTNLQLNGILLGASKSDYHSISGREYDYGPGVGFNFDIGFARRGVDLLHLSHGSFYIHSVNGNDVESFSTTTSARVNLPMRDYLSFSIDYLLLTGHRDYEALPDVDQRSPELRAFLSWDLN